MVPISALTAYLILVLMFCVGQMACSVFSLFSLSVIQARTPQHLTGKIMSYVFTISLCAQPIGQLFYGFLFDTFAEYVYWLLIPSGVLICIIGWMASGFFARLDIQTQTADV